MWRMPATYLCFSELTHQLLKLGQQLSHMQINFHSDKLLHFYLKITSRGFHSYKAVIARGSWRVSHKDARHHVMYTLSPLSLVWWQHSNLLYCRASTLKNYPLRMQMPPVDQTTELYDLERFQFGEWVKIFTSPTTSSARLSSRMSIGNRLWEHPPCCAYLLPILVHPSPSISKALYPSHLKDTFQLKYNV